MKRVIGYLSSAFLLSLATLSSFASSEEIAAVTEQLAPYQFKTEQGEFKGYTIDVVKQLSKITGDTVLIEVMPWARAFNTARDKKNVMIFSMSRTEDREEYFHWVGELLKIDNFYWTLKDRFDEPPITFDEIYRHKIGVTRNSYAHQYLQDKQVSGLFTFVLEEMVIRSLFKKRIDITLGNEIAMMDISRKLGLDTQNYIKLAEVKALTSALYIAFNKGSNLELVNKYKDAFGRLKESGELDTIKRRWQLDF